MLLITSFRQHMLSNMLDMDTTPTTLLNQLIFNIRKLPPLQMMDSIYTWLMQIVHERHRRNQRSTVLEDVPLLKFNDRLANSRRYQVFTSGNGVYQVQIPDSGKKHIVDLEEEACDCTLFQEYRSPCTHAIAACRYKAEDPYELFAEEYKVSSYRETYKHFLRPFSIENLASTSNVLPPVFKKQRGRPTTKRIRKGDWKRKETKCSKCKGTGHNIRKCRFAPAINGRQQRARERDLLVDDSDSSSDSSNSLSSNLDSGVDEEVSYSALDRVDQAESDLYYERIARAHEIVDRRRSEWDLESQSELPGVGVESDNVEMGNTGGNSISHSAQDDQSNSADRQDHGVDSGMGIQGIRISPRRTRSGKVVKYIDQ